MASSAMATAETIVSLDDQHYWGGDLLPVTPLQFLINSSSSKRLLVFHVGSIGLERGLPRTADEAADRERDIHMSGRTPAAIDNFRTLFNLRSSFSQLLNRVPDISLNCQHLELKRTLQQLPAMKLILLRCRVHSDETDIQVAPELRYREWWHAGYQDAVRLLIEESGTLLPPPSGSGLVITSLEPTLDDF